MQLKFKILQTKLQVAYDENKELHNKMLCCIKKFLISKVIYSW